MRVREAYRMKYRALLKVSRFYMIFTNAEDRDTAQEKVYDTDTDAMEPYDSSMSIEWMEEEQDNESFDKADTE